MDGWLIAQYPFDSMDSVSQTTNLQLRILFVQCLRSTA